MNIVYKIIYGVFFCFTLTVHHAYSLEANGNEAHINESNAVAVVPNPLASQFSSQNTLPLVLIERMETAGNFDRVNNQLKNFNEITKKTVLIASSFFISLGIVFIVLKYTVFDNFQKDDIDLTCSSVVKYNGLTSIFNASVKLLASSFVADFCALLSNKTAICCNGTRLNYTIDSFQPCYLKGPHQIECQNQTMAPPSTLPPPTAPVPTPIPTPAPFVRNCTLFQELLENAFANNLLNGTNCNDPTDINVNIDQQPTDADLENLMLALRQLDITNLNINASGITMSDKGSLTLSKIISLRNLKILRLIGLKSNRWDDVIASFSSRLKELYLKDCNIDDAIMYYPYRAYSIEKISLINTGVSTGDYFDYVLEANLFNYYLSNLRYLDLSSNNLENTLELISSSLGSVYLRTLILKNASLNAAQIDFFLYYQLYFEELDVSDNNFDEGTCLTLRSYLPQTNVSC